MPDFFRVAVLCAIATGGCGDNARYRPAVLDDLQVEGARTALNPSFDPAIHRYSIIADDPPGEVAFTPFAHESVIIAIDGHEAESGRVESIAALTPGDVVQIQVRSEFSYTDSAVYEVLYLPTDFPELEVTVIEEGVSSQPLYLTLSGPRSHYVAIVDNHGVPTFYRKQEQRAFDFKRHAATGERSYGRFTGQRNTWDRRDSEIVVLDGDFDEVDRITTVGLTHTDFHDFLILPDNELVVMSYDGSLRDMTAFGLSEEELIEDSVVQILDRATRDVRFEWNSFDEMPYDDQSWPNPRGEYVHVNSMFMDSDGDLIVSARGTSQVVKISRSSGQIMWKLGGKSNQFEFVNDPFSHLCGQHTASRLDNGNLLVFDNGQNCWPIDPARGELTRVVEYQIDEQALRAELVWSYTQDGAYTISQGSAQRLANGNTLIGWGRGADLIATEVDAQGTKLFELTAFDEGEPVVSYRAQRFSE